MHYLFIFSSLWYILNVQNIIFPDDRQLKVLQFIGVCVTKIGNVEFWFKKTSNSEILTSKIQCIKYVVLFLHWKMGLKKSDLRRFFFMITAKLILGWVPYILGAQLFTSLIADLPQDINRVSSFRMCLNETFPWRKCSVKTLLH